MKIVIVGDIDESLADYAKQLYPEAVLDTSFAKSTVIYTSLGDSDIFTFVNLLIEADTIVYHDKDSQWSDSTMKDITEYLLAKFSTNLFKNVKNFSGNRYPEPKFMNEFESQWISQIFAGTKNNYLSVADSRKSEHPHLYIVGCSYAHGYDLSDQNLRYGQILSELRGLPPVFLTLHGTSIDWAADQILRSDLQSGDTLVWGLTSPSRFTWFLQDQQSNIVPNWKNFGWEFDISFKESSHLDYMLMHDSRAYLACKYISQVINMCLKLGIKLVILESKINSTDFHNNLLNNFLSNTPYYLKLPDPIDQTQDKIHPGVKTHEQWAHIINDYLNK